MKKRFLSAILAIVMIISILPVVALTTYAASSGKCGPNATWSLDTETGILEITGSGEMTSIPWSDYTYRKYIKTVMIGDSITNIADNAFSDCYNIETVKIGNMVETIGNNAFYMCDNIKNIVIPDSVKTIGGYAFCWCAGLSSIAIPDSVETIGICAFACCLGLESVTIPGSVTEIVSSTFELCPSLKKIVIPSSITKIGSWAITSDSLEDVYYHNIKTGAVFQVHFRSLCIFCRTAVKKMQKKLNKLLKKR